jgi:hypothetical protein
MYRPWVLSPVSEEEKKKSPLSWVTPNLLTSNSDNHLSQNFSPAAKVISKT